MSYFIKMFTLTQLNAPFTFVSCQLLVEVWRPSDLNQMEKKKFHSLLFFLINIAFPQVRIKKKVFMIVVQIQFEIELFFCRQVRFVTC